ncbi:Protein PTST homolog 3, chloroplastic [Linum perenne]
MENQSSDKESTSYHEPAGLIEEGCDDKANNETGDSRISSTDQDSGHHRSNPIESSVDSLSENHGCENEVLQRPTLDCAPSSREALMDEDISSIGVDDWSSREALFKDEDQNNQDIHLDSDEIQVPVESSGNSCFTSGSDDSKGLDVTEHSLTPMDFEDDTSLEDKVAEFMHTGELGAMDVFSHGADLTANGKAPMSPLVADSAPRNDDPSDQSQTLADLHKDYVEASTSEIQVQINDIKLLLAQKELELKLLKEQIEKETLSLSDLQTKAEIEITKAQQLVIEKDAEMLAVEESLSDLVEVAIQYRGEGQCVEVSGSFNGWHHKILMDSNSDQDPDTSSSAEKIKEPRKWSNWSTTLWLYPGVYEIKFIVDGEWRSNDEMESVTQGGISNNILRVGFDRIESKAE